MVDAVAANVGHENLTQILTNYGPGDC
jgi:hypothetical protein